MRFCYLWHRQGAKAQSSLHIGAGSLEPLHFAYTKYEGTGNSDQKVNEYDQEIPQSHTADQPTAL